MKGRTLVIGIIILVVIVAILIAIALLYHPAPAPSPLSTNPFADAVQTGAANSVASPAVFSTNFYKWYIGNREANPNFPSTAQLASAFTQWMTPAFILQYQSTVNDPNNDADPILYAQDDPLGWGSGMTATILTQTDTASSVKVLIGSGSLVHTYTLQLVKSNGQWLINSISGTY